LGKNQHIWRKKRCNTCVYCVDEQCKKETPTVHSESEGAVWPGVQLNNGEYCRACSQWIEKDWQDNWQDDW